jgi:hypothetical protein
MAPSGGSKADWKRNLDLGGPERGRSRLLLGRGCERKKWRIFLYDGNWGKRSIHGDGGESGLDCGLFETDAHTALTAPISLHCQD